MEYGSEKRINLTLFCIQGIQLKNQSIPSGIYSALQEANITNSILDSYNDVNLRWIGKDNWTYSLTFDGIFRYTKKQNSLN